MSRVDAGRHLGVESGVDTAARRAHRAFGPSVDSCGQAGEACLSTVGNKLRVTKLQVTTAVDIRSGLVDTTSTRVVSTRQVPAVDR